MTLVEGMSSAVGLVGLAVWVSLHVGVATRTRHNVDRFAALQVEAAHPATPDQSLWSPVRVSAWLKVSGEPAPAPLAVLRIQEIRLEVPVLPGTDDRALDRAVGHIEDTAPPGTDGNSENGPYANRETALIFPIVLIFRIVSYRPGAFTRHNEADPRAD